MPYSARLALSVSPRHGNEIYREVGLQAGFVKGDTTTLHLNNRSRLLCPLFGVVSPLRHTIAKPGRFAVIAHQSVDAIEAIQRWRLNGRSNSSMNCGSLTHNS